MRKGRSDGPARSGQLRRFMRASGKRTTAIISVLSLLAIGLVLASCGGGGGDSSQGGSSQNISSPSVSGVASAGAPIAGQVTLKDASTPAQQKVTVIFRDGSFALDVTGMKAPFVLEATGNVNGVSCTLLSFASGPGNANINPLSNVALAYAAKVNDPEQIYKNPDPATLDKVKSGLPQAVADILAKLKPLLQNYGADTIDPITSHYLANHTGLDGFFDDVKFTLANGTLTMINAKTGASIFTWAVTDIMGGYFTNAGSPLPNPGPIPAAPTGVTAAGGVGQVTVSRGAVTGATSYDLYWSATSGVTTVTGTRITGATSPYVQTGLAAGTAYYYIVTAVNSAGESPSSAQVTTTTSTPAPAFDALVFK